VVPLGFFDQLGLEGDVPFGGAAALADRDLDFLVFLHLRLKGEEGGLGNGIGRPRR